MVRTYYNQPNAVNIYGGDSITSPRMNHVKDSQNIFQRRKERNVDVPRREKVPFFQGKSEAQEKYPNYQKYCQKEKREEVMPKNDWPSIVDTRRTIVPQFKEDKDFKPRCGTGESHRNYNGQGNIQDLMLRSNAELDGFHNSNFLYRGASGEKLRSEISRSAMKRHEIVSIQGFENEKYSRSKSGYKRNKSMD